jgi:hypothetical protein
MEMLKKIIIAVLLVTLTLFSVIIISASAHTSRVVSRNLGTALLNGQADCTHCHPERSLNGYAIDFLDAPTNTLSPYYATLGWLQPGKAHGDTAKGELGLTTGAELTLVAFMFTLSDGHMQ